MYKSDCIIIAQPTVHIYYTGYGVVLEEMFSLMTL